MIEIVIGILVMSVIAAFLALLLEIAHAYIADYGEVNIKVNDEKDLTATGGSTLFFSLMDNRIFIPSACGGRGTCSYCKVKVKEGGGPVLPTETPYLSPKEIEDNVRLSCQVKLRNDVRIEIPEELFNVKEYRVKVAEMKPLTSTINGLRLEILEPAEGITFKPGQYIQLQVPAYELSKKPDFRAFSIASSQDRHDSIELMITKAPEGFVSIYVHDYLKIGEELIMRGPFGDFYFRDDNDDREILLCATGSGLAPIRSILYYLEAHDIKRKTTLLFGARTSDDLFYLDEMADLKNKLHDFTYIPILSNQPGDKPWDGETGFITDYINKNWSDNPPLDGYICGAPIVVELCDKTLKGKGVPGDRVFFDAFA